MFKPIHKHLLIKADLKTTITSEQAAKEFLVSVVDVIGMTPVTAPQAVYVADEGNEGFTGSINLSTSHIAFHIWDGRGKTKDSSLLMMDVYSCKDFDVSTVLNAVHFIAGLNILSLEYMVIDRSNFKIMETYR